MIPDFPAEAKACTATYFVESGNLLPVVFLGAFFGVVLACGLVALAVYGYSRRAA